MIICLIRDWLFSTDGKRSVKYDSGQFYCLVFSSLKCKYLIFSAQLPFRVYSVAKHIFSQFKIWFSYQRVQLWYLLYLSLQTVQNTIGTLVRLVPDVLLPEMINHSCSCLDNPALLTVTHMDYAIMNTPEGELWDKSVLQK